MNKIRKSWKRDNFFFHFKVGSDYVHLNHETCARYDKVVVQDDGLTAKDTLVDIVWIQRALCSVQDDLVRSSVEEALLYVFNSVQYIVNLQDKEKGAQR